jgi:hypothetical protein
VKHRKRRDHERHYSSASTKHPGLDNSIALSIKEAAYIVTGEDEGAPRRDRKSKMNMTLKKI